VINESLIKLHLKRRSKSKGIQTLLSLSKTINSNALLATTMCSHYIWTCPYLTESCCSFLEADMYNNWNVGVLIIALFLVIFVRYFIRAGVEYDRCPLTLKQHYSCHHERALRVRTRIFTFDVSQLINSLKKKQWRHFVVASRSTWWFYNIDNNNIWGLCFVWRIVNANKGNSHARQIAWDNAV